MGLDKRYVDLIIESVTSVYGNNYSELKMLELGDQIIDDKSFYHKMTGKEFFSSMGFFHTSVDINGLHGALPKDLRDPFEFNEWHNNFDIITNAGTTEHVEPIESQYQCWNILHDCLKMGGVAIHILPDVHEHDINGAWVGHCRHYYSKTFFEILARECNYEIFFNDIIKGNRCVAYTKKDNSDFLITKESLLENIHIR